MRNPQQAKKNNQVNSRQKGSDKTIGHWSTEDNKTVFRVWAPKRKTLELELKSHGKGPETSDGSQDRSTFHSMERDEDGFFSLSLSSLPSGSEYRYRLDGEYSRPDPAARYFTSSVHDWAQVVDHRSFPWQVNDWKGVAKSDLIIYELHIGTFAEPGTFAGAIERLDELVELGVTAIEILPLAQCPGKWNWGYDGVGLFAVQNTYGTPDDFKRLVDACHKKGIAVILDVVYNHFGPEGNYVAEYGHYFTKKRKTPWGDAVNFDDEQSQFVRSFMAQNATYWLREYRLDGLRLDAVHFMFDDSDEPIPMEITRAVDGFRESVDYPVHMIGETNVHNASLIKSTSPHQTGFDAVWSDCLMHSLLGIGQPGLDLCRRDHFGAADAARALDQGFLYENFPYQRHDRGQRADLDSFVVGTQNHDTVGNHPHGLRLSQLANREFQMASTALYMLYPAIPMMFMGEEFACENPFLFFVDFSDPWVRDGVEKGRAAEFPELMELNGLSPLAPDSFTKSKLGPKSAGDQEVWSWYKSLIEIRKRFRQSGFLTQGNMKVSADPDRGFFRLDYQQADQLLCIACCLAEPGTEQTPISIDVEGEVLLSMKASKNSTNDSPVGDVNTKKQSLGINQAIVMWKSS